MRVGLVGYFGFGNYGDEMFVDVYRSALPQAEFTVLKGCNGVSPHDPIEVAEQDCIIVGGGDLVIASGFSERYWSPVLLGRPVFIAGVGVQSSQGYSPSAVRQMRRFFQHENVRLITVRDSRSRDWIIRHLQPRIPVHVYPDPIASQPMNRTRSGERTFGLVLRGQYETDPANARRLLDRASQLGYRTKIIVLGSGRTRSEDLPVAKAVRVDELSVCDDLHSMTSAVATCDVLVSQRLHGCIAGMMMGIPTIGLRNTDKFKAWFGWFDPAPPLRRVDDPHLSGLLDEPLCAADPVQIEEVRTQARRGIRHLSKAISTVDATSGSTATYYDRGFLGGPEQERIRWAQLSPRLRENAGADLRLSDELRWYRREIARRKGVGYLATIDRHVADTPELGALPADTGAVVTIPVAAAAENETIHNTISLYAQQGADALASTTILLFVNYPDDAHTDPQMCDAVSSTLSEIERARTSFPGLRLATVTEAFDHGLPERHHGIIGYVGRRMYDVALMAVLNGIELGRIHGERGVLLIRNDADAVGMSRRYLERMTGAAAQHPDADVFIGGIRWGTAHYEEFPGFGVVMGFKEGIRALTMRRGSEYWRLPATNGTSFAIRMSALAAVGGVGHSHYYGAGGDDIEIGGRINNARRRSHGAHPGRFRSIRYVTDAQIDASGERALGVYRSGKSVIHTWDSFNGGRNGYTERGDAGGDHPAEPDRNRPEVTIERIAQAVTDLVTHWYPDRRLADSALRLMFGSTDDAGRPIYRTQWTSDGFRFDLTDEGRAWMTQRLGQDGTGKCSPYGHRTRRALYQSVGGASPRMVSPRGSTTPPASRPSLP